MEGVSDLVGSGTYRQISDWVKAHGAEISERGKETSMRAQVQILFADWLNRRASIDEVKAENDSICKGPLGGRCDSLGQIMVKVTGVSTADVEKSSLVVHPTREKVDNITAPQPQHEGGSKAKSTGGKPSITKNGLGDTISNGYTCVGVELKNERSQDPVDKITAQMQKAGISDETNDKESIALAIPILVGEHKRLTDGTSRETGTNQLRMYLTSAVKYLEAIGITGVPVYGVQTDGPIAVFSAAVIKGEYGVCTVIVYVLGHTADGVYSTECPSVRAAGD